MTKTLKLVTYDGKPSFFVVEDVEEVLCAHTYTCSGDQCACIIYMDGSFVILDSDAENERLMSFGPEESNVLLASEIPWEPEVSVHAA